MRDSGRALSVVIVLAVILIGIPVGSLHQLALAGGDLSVGVEYGGGRLPSSMQSLEHILTAHIPLMLILAAFEVAAVCWLVVELRKDAERQARRARRPRISPRREARAALEAAASGEAGHRRGNE